MSRLTKVIAPILREHGLDVREVEGTRRRVRELVVTNPGFPHWGRLSIDDEGLLEWEHWGDTSTDAGAADIAAVALTILASTPGTNGDRYGKHRVHGGPDRPHP